MDALFAFLQFAWRAGAEIVCDSHKRSSPIVKQGERPLGPQHVEETTDPQPRNRPAIYRRHTRNSGKPGRTAYHRVLSSVEDVSALNVAYAGDALGSGPGPGE